MPECHYCGKEAGEYIYNGSKNVKYTRKRIYCNKECARKAQFNGINKGDGKGFLLNSSIYQDGKEKYERLKLFNKAKEGCETAILALKLRYGCRVIQ